MIEATTEMIRRDLDSLPAHYKTKDVDALIRRYVREGYDVSCLRGIVLREQQFHRIYFHTTLRQIRDVRERAAFIDSNLLFSDWWHTDQLIDFVSDLDFETAMRYAHGYVQNGDPFVRRWGYVMWISKLCRQEERLDSILSLMKDDDAYYVQMAQAWLIAELAVFFPQRIWAWMNTDNTLRYCINGKAIQKICDSYRVGDADKERFKALRPKLKEGR